MYNTTERIRERRIHNTHCAVAHPSCHLAGQARSSAHQPAGYPSVPIRNFQFQHAFSKTQMRNENTNLVVFPDLTNYRKESLIDVDRLLGGCFHEDASEVLCQITTLYETSYIIIDQSAWPSQIPRSGTAWEARGWKPGGMPRSVTSRVSGRAGCSNTHRSCRLDAHTQGRTCFRRAPSGNYPCP